MLRFTRDRASVAADTFAIVYDKSEVHFLRDLPAKYTKKTKEEANLYFSLLSYVSQAK